MTLGEKIKLLRKSKNLTQNELGTLLNVSFQAVSKWEKNASQPDIDTIKKLCEIFEVNVDDFLKDDFSLKPNKEVVHKKIEKPITANQSVSTNEKALVLSRNQFTAIVCSAVAFILVIVGIILGVTIPNSGKIAFMIALTLALFVFLQRLATICFLALASLFHKPKL